ncbi:VWA domain-containing protein [bacterium]|nr:VWA domain-containing protein [bacterium]
MSDRFGISLESGHSLWLWLLIAALAALVLWSYRRTWPPVGAPYRALLICLRLAVFTVAAWLIFQPVLTWSVETRRRERVAVLLDNSASMRLPASAAGGPDSSSRVELALSLLGGLHSDSLSALYTFGDRLAPLTRTDSLGSTPSGRTDLAAALRQVIAPGAPAWDRIYVLSDGAVNSGEDPTALAAALPPLESVIVGRTPSAPDLALAALSQSRPAYDNEPVELELSVAVNLPPGAHSLPSGAAPVVDFQVDGSPVASLRLDAGSLSGRFIGGQVKLPPLPEGEHVLRAVLRPLPGEWTERNNERLLILEVARGRHPLLLVTDAADWDFTFLHRALSLNQDWAVSALVLLGGELHSVRSQDREGRFSAGRLPDDKELENIELVLLHGDLARLDRSFLERVAARAARGSLAPVLWPSVRLDPSALPAGLAACLHFASVPAPLVPQPARDIPCRLLPDNRFGLAVQAGDEELPPVESVMRLPGLAPDVVPLAALSGAASGLAADPHGAPLIVVRDHDGVRSATVLGTGLWRWHMLSQESPGQDIARYERLWETLAGWLISGRRSEGGTLRPERNVFQWGEAVAFSAPGADASDSLTLRLSLVREPEGPGEVPDSLPSLISSSPDPGQARRVVLGALTPGVYRWRVTAENPAAEARDYGGLFAVESYSPELAVVQPDTTLPAALARATGGGLTDSRAFSGRIGDNLTRRRVRHSLSLAGESWLYFVLIALLSAEWILRRRRSLA